MRLPAGVRRDRIEPLWDRIGRERVRLALFLGVFVVSIALTAALVIAGAGTFLGVVLVSQTGTAEFFAALPWVVAAGTAVAMLAAAAYLARMLKDPKRRLLRTLGATRSGVGTMLPVKSALHDMAVAAGFVHPPQLWVIEECERVNAFSIAFGSGEPVVGVTRGFVDRVPVEYQRAVFANLVERLRNGTTLWATAVSVVMGPIWRYRERQLREESDADDIRALADGAAAANATGSGGGGEAIVAWVLVSALAVVVTELLMAGHERAALDAASKADAEGMLLLKDPTAMLDALEAVLQANNTVPTAGEAYSMLFYCWAGFGFAPEDDPEMIRVARLREVLGAEGLADTRADRLDARAAEAIARLAPPPAPTIEDEGPQARR